MMKHYIEKLKRLSKQYQETASQPFVPYHGDAIDADDPRIMYIGKATFGWGEVDIEDKELINLSRGFVVKKVIKGKYHSPFWSHAIELVEKIYRSSGSPFKGQEEQKKAWALKRIYWTNLVKVGAKGGNAIGPLLHENVDLFSDILCSEILDFKPTIIVLVSNGYAHKITDSVFGVDGWKKDALEPNSLWHKRSVKFNCMIYWTRHPQGWAKDCRLRILAEIEKNYRSFL